MGMRTVEAEMDTLADLLLYVTGRRYDDNGVLAVDGHMQVAG